MDDVIGRNAVISLHRLIGERIRLSRMIAGITREELASRMSCTAADIPPEYFAALEELGAVGFKASHVEAWERGDCITAPIVACVVRALGVPLSFLVTNCHDEP